MVGRYTSCKERYRREGVSTISKHKHSVLLSCPTARKTNSWAGQGGKGLSGWYRADGCPRLVRSIATQATMVAAPAPTPSSTDLRAFFCSLHSCFMLPPASLAPALALEAPPAVCAVAALSPHSCSAPHPRRLPLLIPPAPTRFPQPMTPPAICAALSLSPHAPCSCWPPC